jgi:DNA helicase-2/ATP-dependent DNA helicase PcrA
MPLTASQMQAVEHANGNLQIIACAGSGKTEVVARRVARLLRDGMPGGLKPSNIVAFTFTEKAAAELKDRIVARVQDEVGEVPGLAELYVGTIHAFCLELIKTELPKYLKYEVLSDVQRLLFVDRNSNRSGLGTSHALNGQQLRRYVDTKVYCRALDVMREDLVDRAALAGCDVAANAVLYDGLLDEKSFLDYSSILAVAAAELERNDALRARIAGRVKYLIVDEYQDVNPVQERVVRAMHGLGAALCVVGDDDQTIYQWRGSHVRNIVEFASRYPSVTPVRLQENFRSSAAIVEIARDFIAQNPNRLAKSMQPAGKPIYEDGDVLALGFQNPEEEAQFIVAKIRELQGICIPDGEESRGLSLSDIAILLRSVSKNGAVIVDALKAAEIPHIVIGLSGLFSADEAQAARLSFYWLADHGGTTESMVRDAWSDAKLGLRVTELEAGMRFLRETKVSLQGARGGNWSQYSLQRTYLSLLETLALTEERVPGKRGEVVFYNLGKFSQVISDFEQINFQSEPAEKYKTFAGFLQHQADEVYEEGGQDTQRAAPDAVRVMTIHQSKGMQWPAVFIPALLRNRFPAAGIGGRTVWHLIPDSAVTDAARYRGGIEDERRLFYVAMTRAEKFLFMTYAPIAGFNNRYLRSSEFFSDVLPSTYVKRHNISLAQRVRRCTPRPRRAIAGVVLSFSELKYYFECPYQFKLRVLYGFNAPIHEALGYGKSLHDCLAEVHGRAMQGDFATPSEAAALVARHLRAPFAYPELRENLRRAAERVVADYLTARQADLPRVRYFEKAIEIDLGDGVSVVGRIDLVRHTDTNKTSIVDLKSSEQAQDEALTEKQLHIYALGYEQLTGERADLVEIYNLEVQARAARAVDQHFIDEVKADVARAASAMRIGEFAATPARARCALCDHAGLCGDCER